MTVESITESVWTRLVARAAMIVTPLIVTLFGWFTFNYLDLRFAEQAANITTVVSRVDRIETASHDAASRTEAIATRTAIVENNQQTGQRTQDQIINKLDLISNTLSDLREKSASISATVEAIKRKDP